MHCRRLAAAVGTGEHGDRPWRCHGGKSRRCDSPTRGHAESVEDDVGTASDHRRANHPPVRQNPPRSPRMPCRLLPFRSSAAWNWVPTIRSGRYTSGARINATIPGSSDMSPYTSRKADAHGHQWRRRVLRAVQAPSRTGTLRAEQTSSFADDRRRVHGRARQDLADDRVPAASANRQEDRGVAKTTWSSLRASSPTYPLSASRSES